MEPRFNFHVEGGYTKESSFFIRVGTIFFFWPEGGEGGGGVITMQKVIYFLEY